jgi:hypothetical protein
VRRIDMERAKKEWHWEILVAIILVIGTVLGIVIPLHMAESARSDRLYEMFIDLLKEKK